MKTLKSVLYWVSVIPVVVDVVKGLIRGYKLGKLDVVEARMKERFDRDNLNLPDNRH